MLALGACSLRLQYPLGVRWVRVRRANHLWDCSVYVLALAYILRLRLYRKANPADQRGEDDQKIPIVRRRAKYQILR